MERHQADFERLIRKFSQASPEWINQVLQTRQTELLLEMPPLYTDDRMFAHVHGDHFIKDSGFESSVTSYTIMYRLAVLGSKLQSILGHPLCDAKTSVQFCKHVFHV